MIIHSFTKHIVKSPIIYFFDGRSTYIHRHKQSFFIYQAGILMEHFLQGIALLGHWYINNQNEKSNKYIPRYYLASILS